MTRTYLAGIVHWQVGFTETTKGVWIRLREKQGEEYLFSILFADRWVAEQYASNMSSKLAA